LTTTRDDIVKVLNHPDRAKAKVIRVINSCVKFEQLTIAWNMMMNHWKVFYSCNNSDNSKWNQSECNKRYINKYRELNPKDNK